jgi:hypothetical protein
VSLITRPTARHPPPSRLVIAARQATPSGRWVDAVEADHLDRIPTDPTPAVCRDEPEQYPWRGSPFGGKALAVTHAEIAPRDGRPRRRDVALDQLPTPRTSRPRNGRTASKTIRTHLGSRAKWRSFTSPLAITTSKASSIQRNHTGTVCALPSLR